MNFKESVKNYLGNSLNEMALKHLEGTEDLWKKQDKEVEIADKYIKNALADGKTYTQILRGLGSTFGSKKLRDMEGRVVKPFIVKEIVLETVREKMKKEESTRYRSNSLNEMALKHFKDTEELWKKPGTEEKIADTYIKNALRDGLTYRGVVQGLGTTLTGVKLDDAFSKKFRKMPGRVIEPLDVAKIIRKKMKKKIKKEDETRKKENLKENTDLFD